jgi:hypothetical protein
MSGAVVTRDAPTYALCGGLAGAMDSVGVQARVTFARARKVRWCRECGTEHQTSGEEFIRPVEPDRL